MLLHRFSHRDRSIHDLYGFSPFLWPGKKLELRAKTLLFPNVLEKLRLKKKFKKEINITALSCERVMAGREEGECGEGRTERERAGRTERDRERSDAAAEVENKTKH
jgi:hypothetical protein